MLNTLPMILRLPKYHLMRKHKNQKPKEDVVYHIKNENIEKHEGKENLKNLGKSVGASWSFVRKLKLLIAATEIISSAFQKIARRESTYFLR